VGDAIIGGTAPILIQSMTNTNTRDIEATVKQSLELARAGCELIRITAPTAKDAECLQEIVAKIRKEGYKTPVSADIHFQPKAAFEALKWVEKVRINPGNFVDSKAAELKEYTDESFERGVQKVYETFGPLVQEAKQRGVCLRIGTNHGSLSDRIMSRYGDTVEGMVESALEFLRVCEGESFDQVVFSMKASNPRVVVQAYRLLAARLEQEHQNYPFHVGVTEAGDGEDGRLKSAVGIGALLLDGIGDTIRVSLTEDPVLEIPVAKDLVDLCGRPFEQESLNTEIETIESFSKEFPENVDYFHYQRRDLPKTSWASLELGGREKIAVGVADPGAETLPVGERQVEWHSTHQLSDVASHLDVYKEGRLPQVVESEISQTTDLLNISSSMSQLISSGDLLNAPESFDGTGVLEIQVECLEHLIALDEQGVLSSKSFSQVMWSILPEGSQNVDVVGLYRGLVAWLHKLDRKDLIVLRGVTDGSAKGNMKVACELGGVLADGVGDLIHIASAAGCRAAMNLGYDVLQAAGVRRSKTEYVSCPSCGRTLFDLETTTQKIRKVTSHLSDVSIAIMGCIVNGPGEMADADFGYVGGAPEKVNLYVGRDCVQKNIPEAEAPDALIDLIKDHGKWKEPA
jgi:(E)-4-hydroxy-3-methylbut-2-enyl-diphosphate synthase